MADAETKKEWAKSKRVETERMKAAQALAEEKPNKVNQAYLDPKATKVKGWSNDPDVILANAERMGNRSMIFALGGILMSIIGYTGGIVTSTFNLGLGGVVISGLPSMIGKFCVFAGVLMSLVTVGCETYFKFKNRRKFSAVSWTALVTLGLVALYILILRLIM